ncbi:MAG: DivIVA domain-containing protein [Lachnospiraceae bacterium]|nr:DivIVA domain-containing protein [Lachnospiraceae bacterium]
MLTPIEIHNKEHKHGRGYSKKEMDEFLDEISEDYETLYKENRDLKEKLEKLSEGIQYYKNLEATLQKALVLAERTSKETIDTANEKAELIQKEAKYKAEQIVNRGITTYESIRQQCISLMQQYSQFKLQFKQIAMKQLELFESDFYEIHTKDFMAQINAAVDTFTYTKDETATDDISASGSVVTTAKNATADSDVSANDTITTAKSASPATDISATIKSVTTAAKDISANKKRIKKNTPSDGLTEITADLTSDQSDSGINNTGDTKEIPDIKNVMTVSSTTKNNQTEKNNVTKTEDDTSNAPNNNTSDNPDETDEDSIESMIRGLRNELSGNISDLQQDNNSPFEYLN